MAPKITLYLISKVEDNFRLILTLTFIGYKLISDGLFDLSQVHNNNFLLKQKIKIIDRFVF